MAGSRPASISLRLLPLSVKEDRLQKTARQRREELLQADKLLTQEAAGAFVDGEAVPPPIYVLDVYGGSAAVWNWLRKDGDLWHDFLWEYAGEAMLSRLLDCDGLRAALAIDGQTYEEMLGRPGESLERLREAAASGRLESINGLFARARLPSLSGESLLRQLFYGLEASERATDGLVNSFLLDKEDWFAQIPQILAGFGFRQVMLRSAGGFDYDGSFFTLAAPDCSEIMAALVRPPSLLDSDSNGHASISEMAFWDARRLDELRAESSGRSAHAFLLRESDVASLDAPLPAATALAARNDIRFVTPREYAALAPEKPPLATARPCVAAQGHLFGLDGERLRRDTLEAEKTLLLAERLDALAYAVGHDSDEASLEGAWKQLLRSQDESVRLNAPLLAPKLSRTVGEAGQQMAHEAWLSARSVGQAAARYLASLVDSSNVSGHGLVVFNPSSWARSEYMEVTLDGESFRVMRGDHVVPSQVVERTGGKVTLGFIARVPPLGYQLLDLQPIPPSVDAQSVQPLSAVDDLTLANPFYSAEIDGRGNLRVYSAEGRTLVESGGHLTVWRKGRRHDSRDGLHRAELKQRGPVFERYRLEGAVGGIKFSQFLTFYEALPRIDLRTEVDFGRRANFGPEPSSATEEEGKKLCLNMLSSLPQLLAGSPFHLDETAAATVASPGFVGLAGDDGRGIGLLNRGTPGYHFDAVHGVLGNVLAWAPRQRPQPPQSLLDSSTSGALTGKTAYRNALLPFGSRLEALRAVEDYQLPWLGVFVDRHTGRLPNEGSFLSVEPAEALLSTLFVRDKRVYVRLWNTSDKPQEATVNSGGSPLSLRACSLRLDDQATTSRVEMAPWAIQTLRLEGGQAPG